MSIFVRLQQQLRHQSTIHRIFPRLLSHSENNWNHTAPSNLLYRIPSTTVTPTAFRYQFFSSSITTMSDSAEAPAKAADATRNDAASEKKPNNNNNNNEKAGKPKRHHNHNKKNNQNNKRRKKVDTNHTWRENRGKNEVHPGSYAHPDMRQRYNITIPAHLLPPSDTPSFEQRRDRKEVSAEAAAAKKASSEDGTTNANNDATEGRTFSKKKVAFLLAYLGTGYSGFQTNEGMQTLQAEFELALLKSELLNPLNFGHFHKYSWSTSGRTDKGVHACAQVCSAKIQMLPDQSMDDVRELINQHLSPNFRVLDVVRTTNSFCAKTARSKVRYQYMIPSFFFFDRKKLAELMQRVAPLKGRTRNMGAPCDEAEIRKIQETINSYRVTPEQLEALQTALHQYEGTHSFHNFTKGLSAKDPSAARYIISFNVEKPRVFENGMEWIPTQVVGQSFLLHQIRKMISVGLDSVRMGLPNMISSALEKDCKIVTNLAPAQGLFMEMSFYDTYNEVKTATADVEELDWATEGTPVNDRWKDFRNNVIMEHVVEEEEKAGNFIQYLYNHEYYFDRKENYEALGVETEIVEDQEQKE